LRQGLEVELQNQAQRQEPAPTTTAQSEAGGETLDTVLKNTSAQIQTSVNAPSSISGDRDVTAVYRACQEPLRTVSQYLRSKKLTDPEAYRINRFVTWLGITQLPPAQDGKTQLKPVSKEKLDAYQTLAATQNWNELLPEVETSTARAPYWLDGHRLAHEALSALNAKEAADVVAEGVRGFIARFPQVVNYRFSDDTPFADDATRQWINREVNAARQTGGTSTGISVDQESISANWQQAYEEATQLAADKKLRDAMALFQLGCAQSTSLREQSLWRFNQARFCFENGLIQLAVPLLENLDRQLTEKGVEEWEPQITTKVLELLLRCYRDGAAAPENRVEALHARLCRHDLALAFDLSNH